MTAAAVVVVVAGMKAAVTILVPFLLAAFIATVVSPALGWLRSKDIPGWLTLLIVITAVVVIGAVLATVVGTSVLDFSGDLPTYEAALRQKVAGFIDWLDARGVDTSGLRASQLLDVGAAMRLTAATLNGLSNLLANGFLILMTVIFMLLEASSLPAKLKTIAGGRSDGMARFHDFFRSINRYMAIKTVVSLATGVVIAIWLAILGVNYAPLWGLLAFLLNYVPNIGSILAAIPAVVLAFVQLGTLRALGAAGGYLVVNIVMGNVIEPRLMGRGLGLSTLVVFLSLLFWGWVLGPVGMLLSVPLTVMVKIALDSHEETRWLAVLLGR
jgi:AI-2 transport protein TqsA